MHRHDKDLVHFVKIRVKAADGGFRVNHDRIPQTHGPYPLQFRMDVTVSLDVYLDRLRTRLGKGLKVEIGAGHHEMDVPGEPRRHLRRKGHHIRTERKVRNEMRVHHIKMECLRAGRFGTEYLVSEPTEIGGEKRWKYFSYM